MIDCQSKNFFESLTSLSKRSKQLEVMSEIQANNSVTKVPHLSFFSNANGKENGLGRTCRSPLLALISLQVGLTVFFVLQGKK